MTIATNMAGRGTDIKLGGNVEMRLRRELDVNASPAAQSVREQAIRAEMASNHERVKQAGGLLVVGTERHESRRIDNQLRGRSGRQGDPGASRFFLSLEDDLMRIFGSERMGGMLQRLGLKEGEAIVHPWINKALEKAQKKVEARNFDTRKNLLKYDDVMNDQRREVYAQRREFMNSSDVSQTVAEMRQELVDGMVTRRVPERAFAEQWETEDLQADVKRVFNLDLPIVDWGREEGIDETGLRERIAGAVEAAAADKAEKFGPEVIRYIEKSLLLQVFDTVWKEHLLALDHLRQGIGLRAVQHDAGRHARAGLRHAVPRRALRRTAAAAAARLRQHGGEPPRGVARRRRGGRRNGAHPDDRRRADAGRFERSHHVGRRVAQCALPLRVGEEVQALPWEDGLAEQELGGCAIPPAPPSRLRGEALPAVHTK